MAGVVAIALAVVCQLDLLKRCGFNCVNRQEFCSTDPDRQPKHVCADLPPSNPSFLEISFYVLTFLKVHHWIDV